VRRWRPSLRRVPLAGALRTSFGFQYAQAPGDCTPIWRTRFTMAPCRHAVASFGAHDVYAAARPGHRDSGDPHALRLSTMDPIGRVSTARPHRLRDGRIEVDMSPEDVFTHGTLKSKVAAAIERRVEELD
jgi:hypothetical protein